MWRDADREKDYGVRKKVHGGQRTNTKVCLWFTTSANHYSYYHVFSPMWPSLIYDKLKKIRNIEEMELNDETVDISSLTAVSSLSWSCVEGGGGQLIRMMDLFSVEDQIRGFSELILSTQNASEYFKNIILQSRK